MASYVIDPGGGGDHLTIAAFDAARGDGDVGLLVDGPHSVGTGLSLAHAVQLQSVDGVSVITGTGSYLLRGPASKTVTVAGGYVDCGACLRGLDIENTRTFDVLLSRFVLHGSADGTNQHVGCYLNAGGKLKGSMIFEGGYSDAYHTAIWSAGGVFDGTSPDIQSKGRGVRVESSTTGTMGKVDIYQEIASYNNGFYLNYSSGCSLKVNNLRIRHTSTGIYKPAGCIYADHVEFNFVTIDDINYGVSDAKGEIFRNVIVSTIGVNAFSSSGGSGQTAPDYVLWDGTGSLTASYTAPTNQIEGDPEYSDSDLHLRYSSPARAAGLAILGIDDDFDGVERPASPSIGCFEADSSSQYHFNGGIQTTGPTDYQENIPIGGVPEAMIRQVNDAIAAAGSPMVAAAMPAEDSAEALVDPEIPLPAYPHLLAVRIMGIGGPVDLDLLDSEDTVVFSAALSALVLVRLTKYISTRPVGDLRLRVSRQGETCAPVFLCVQQISESSTDGSQDISIDASGPSYISSLRFDESGHFLSVSTIQALYDGIEIARRAPQVYVASAHLTEDVTAGYLVATTPEVTVRAGMRLVGAVHGDLSGKTLELRAAGQLIEEAGVDGVTLAKTEAFAVDTVVSARLNIDSRGALLYAWSIYEEVPT